uniref:Uncharacterized protein n=1 Tax=Arundo donax TaxID=35708 RepID=A0A0A9DY50_ARUDO
MATLAMAENESIVCDGVWCNSSPRHFIQNNCSFPCHSMVAQNMHKCIINNDINMETSIHHPFMNFQNHIQSPAFRTCLQHLSVSQRGWSESSRSHLI